MARRKLTANDLTRKLGSRIVLRRPDEVEVATNGYWILVEVTGWAQPPWRSYKLLLNKRARKNVYYLGIHFGELRLVRNREMQILETHHPDIAQWVVIAALDDTGIRETPLEEKSSPPANVENNERECLK
ncbi:MAG: hypothetical protein WCL08_13040 [Verrucomicrobiota bacterium]